MAKGGGLLELMGLLAGKIPGASRVKGGVGTGFDWLRKAVTPSIEPFRQARYPAGSPKAFIKQNPLQIRKKRRGWAVNMVHILGELMRGRVNPDISERKAEEERLP